MKNTKLMLETLHGIDFKDLNGSTQRIFEEQHDIMIAQGVGKINAELMAAGIQWYLDTMARPILSN